MKEINTVNSYRECIRNLWNIHFMPSISINEDWDAKDSFDQICTILFSVLVLDPLGLNFYKKAFSYEQHPKPINVLQVKPATASVPIMINREVKSVGYWDYPVKSISPDEAEMSFIDLFDFEQLGFRDFEFYRVRIVNSSTDKNLVGRDALIRCSNAKVLLCEPGT